MTISIICTNKDPAPWVEALHALEPSINIQISPNEQDKEKVEFALCWKQPSGILQHYPNLKCICSMGAGVDHLLNDPLFPKHLPVIRLIDPLLAQSMFDYISTAVMYFFRAFDIYHTQKGQQQWLVHPLKSKAHTTIGIMGLGQLGAYAAENLAKMGFTTIGWSSSEKSLVGVTSYAGEKALAEFLAQTDILICLLPLTEQTRSILNHKLFEQLPKGACVINVARGEHLVEQDLINALDNGQIRAACLDVFHQEPLPSHHPLWQHPNVLLTPHCSSITQPEAVAPQIIENYQRLTQGKPLLNQVDLQRGY